MQLNVLRKWEFFLLLSPSLFGIQKFRVFFFYENWSNMRSKTWLIKLQKIVGNFSDKLRKIVPKWNAHLEIFSRIQAIENSWQSWFSEQIFYRKQSLGAPAIWPQRQGKWNPNFYSGWRNFLRIDQNLVFSSPVFPEITREREKGNLLNVEEQEVVAQSSEPEAQNDSKWK